MHNHKLLHLNRLYISAHYSFFYVDLAVGLAQTKPFKIKALLTYVFYITSVIVYNMLSQLLLF